MRNKKLILASCLLSIILWTFSPVISNATSVLTIDKSLLNQGAVTVKGLPKDSQGLLIRISKGLEHYDYQITEGQAYPLQMGNGTYHILLATLVNANQYRVLSKEQVVVQINNESSIFLHSIPNVSWKEALKVSEKAKELVEGLTTDAEKTKAIYSYITHTIAYDWKKVEGLGQNYTPNLDQVYVSGSGICYDYSAVFAGMLRSVGVPTKLIMGYNKSNLEVYHAWNQVWLNDEGRWVTIDTTYDALYVQNNKVAAMEKIESDYIIHKVY